MSLLIEALKRAELQRKQQRAEAAAQKEAAEAAEAARGDLPELTLTPLAATAPAAPAAAPSPDFPAISLEVASPEEFSSGSAAAPPTPADPRVEPTLAPLTAPIPDTLTLADFEAPPAKACLPEPPPAAPAPEPPAPPGETAPPPPLPHLPPPPPPPAAQAKPADAARPAPAVGAAKTGATPPGENQLKAQALKTMLTGQNAPTASGKRRLLLIALFGLSAVAGMGAYLWWLSADTPHSSLLTAAAPTGEALPEPAPLPQPLPPALPPAPGAPDAPAASRIAPAETKPAPAAPAAAIAATPPLRPAARPPVETRPATQPGARTPVIRRNDPADDAWQALRAGRTAEASENYRKALRNDPRNREVLLGLAEAAVREGQAMQAIDYYERVLRLNPRDPDANAGMALLHGHSDPTSYEARLQALLGEQSGNAGLHFALGALLAGQKRWHEAQQAFFQAATLAPDNADYQYNLAVSLDQMGKYRNARDFYEKALLLSQKRPGNFPRDTVQARLEVLTDFIR